MKTKNLRINRNFMILIFRDKKGKITDFYGQNFRIKREGGKR